MARDGEVVDRLATQRSIGRVAADKLQEPVTPFPLINFGGPVPPR